MDQNTLNTLNEIVSLVMRAAEATSLEQALERIVHASRELIPARYAALSVPGEDGRLKFFKVSGISSREFERIAHPPQGLGLLGVIQKDRATLRLEKMTDHPESVGFCPGHPEMTSLLAAPIQAGQQYYGSLYMCDRIDGNPFTTEDQWLIEMLSGYVALAIAGARLNEQQSRLTLLEERERIAMELHDGVIQSLYATGMHLELIRSANNMNPEDLLPVVSDLNYIIEDIRRYIHDLKRRNHNQTTIYDSLRGVVSRLHIPESVDINIDAPNRNPPFMPSTFDAICQIANEAISNAVRHADAHKITITARQTDDFFQITIIDDGRGFDLERLPHKNGLGLRNIQQRARLHNGDVYIESSPEEGTRLVITIPMQVS